MQIETKREFLERLENKTQANQESKEAGCNDCDWTAPPNTMWMQTLLLGAASDTSVHLAQNSVRCCTAVIVANSNLCCQTNSCSRPRVWKSCTHLEYRWAGKRACLDSRDCVVGVESCLPKLSRGEEFSKHRKELQYLNSQSKLNVQYGDIFGGLEILWISSYLLVSSCFLFLIIKKKFKPQLVWLSGLNASLWTKRSWVWFPAKAHAWVAGQVPSWGCVRGNQLIYLSYINVSFLLFLPPPLSKNKFKKRFKKRNLCLS